jgi:tRNA threonylcarbamoyladenosine biosynthesis protein TsaB
MNVTAKPLVSLAIETSGHDSSVALGIGDEIAAIGRIAQKRHAVDLVPTIDALFKDNALTPADLCEIYISIGPGSFTGLRIGITVAKLLARTTSAKIVAVPTVDALAYGLHAIENLPNHIAILLNIKNNTGWGSLYSHTRRGYEPCIGKVGLITLDELLHAHNTGAGLNYNAMPMEIGDDLSPRGLGLICEILPESIESTPDPAAQLTRLGVTRLPHELTLSQASSVWHVGRDMAHRGQFTDPLHIAPLYAREPEAVTLWNKRHGEP